MAESEYKKVYYIPALESKLAYAFNNRAHWRNPRHEGVNNALNLLQQEIGRELKHVGANNFKEVDKLSTTSFDSSVYQNTSRFLITLKQFYSNRMNAYGNKKEALIDSLTNTKEKQQKYDAERSRYVNKAVSDAVRNITTSDRIVEYNGSLIQKIYPIYVVDHSPRSPMDFSANLYQPTKHFLGRYFDTLAFNIAIIWAMTILLFIALYFDLLKKLVKVLENNRKYRRKDKL
jgi:ABC transport system ATP-binding/permease protein